MPQGLRNRSNLLVPICALLELLFFASECRETVRLGESPGEESKHAKKYTQRFPEHLCIGARKGIPKNLSSQDFGEVRVNFLV